MAGENETKTEYPFDQFDTSFQNEEDCQKISSDLIQIKADSESEVNRRIDAFIRNKRNEVNERNVREFISPFSSVSDSSCARVEAVYIHREGEKSHISLKKVTNSYGPQTRLPPDEGNTPVSQSRVPLDVQRAEAIEERLSNMEAHLDINSEGYSILGRVKALESRISFLEGLSPEYFSGGVPQNKVEPHHKQIKEEKETVSSVQVESMTDIKRRIWQLKQILKSKADDKKSLY